MKDAAIAKFAQVGFDSSPVVWQTAANRFSISHKGLSQTMGTVDARGTKRSCQNNDCGARFYDLNRDPITCPICDATYAIAHAPARAVIPEEPKPKVVERLPEEEADTEEKAAAEEGELADIETDETIPDDDDEADVFLEAEEEDEGNVTDIIPGIAEGEGEET